MDPLARGGASFLTDLAVGSQDASQQHPGAKVSLCLRTSGLLALESLHMFSAKIKKKNQDYDRKSALWTML